MRLQPLPWLARLVPLLWPPQCLLCATPVADDHGFCPQCWPQMPFVSGLICDHCGAPLPGEAPPVLRALCDDCLQFPPPWSRGRAAFLYAEGARSLALQLKHADRPDLARSLGDRMARAGRDLLADNPLIVPVPLHPWRLVRRRYNQAALLARRIAQTTGQDWMPDLLQRRRATPPQDKRSRAERRDNLAGALRIHPRHAAMLRNRRILLVDDVMTTGATLAEATRVLQAGGAADVSVLTLARVAEAP